MPGIAAVAIAIYAVVMTFCEAPFLLPARAPARIGILVLDQCNTLSLAATVDPLRAANRRAGRPLYHWTFLSTGSTPPRLTAGFAVPARPLARADDLDALAIVAGFRIGQQATPGVLGRIRQLAPRVDALMGIDGGSWLLAAAGLLDGHRATTHWEDLEEFAARFPRVEAVDARFVISGRCMTTAGAAPCLDMMLHMLSLRHGHELALQVAGTFLYDQARAPEALQGRLPSGDLARRDPRLAAAVEAMLARLEDPVPVATIARRVGLSAKGLEGLFRRTLGVPPGTFWRNLRLDEARRLVEETALGMREISLRTGFGSAASLSRAFSRRFGMAPASWRAQKRLGPRSVTTASSG